MEKIKEIGKWFAALRGWGLVTRGELAVFIVIVLAIILDNVFGTIQGVNFALFGIDDALLIAGGSALAGGLADLFGGDDSEEYINYLKEQKTQYLKDAQKRKLDLIKLNEAQKKQRLTRANQAAASKGFDPVSSSYANEEDLDNALMSNLSTIDTSKDQYLRELDQQIAAAGMGQETGLQKFVGGALTGANLGLGAANMMKTPAPSPAGFTGTPSEGGQLEDVTKEGLRNEGDIYGKSGTNFGGDFKEYAGVDFDFGNLGSDEEKEIKNTYSSGYGAKLKKFLRF